MNAGIVKASIACHWFGKSHVKKTPFIGITWKVGEDTIDSETYISPNSAGMARKLCKIMGFDMDAQDADLEILNREQFKYAGAEAQLDIREESYEDQVRLKVKWINPLREAPTPEEGAKAIAMLRAAKGAKKKGASKPAHDPSWVPPSQQSDEDIPF